MLGLHQRKRKMLALFRFPVQILCAAQEALDTILHEGGSRLSDLAAHVEIQARRNAGLAPLNANVPGTPCPRAYIEIRFPHHPWTEPSP